MARLLPLLIAIATAASASLASGCADAQAPDTSRIDPVRMATILPTPAGFTEGDPARALDAEGLAAALGGAGALDAIEGSGLRRAAVREWTGPDGRRLSVTVGVWHTDDGARYVTGGAAERELSSAGAAAWTPEEIRASRGVRRDGDRPVRTLSFAIGTAGVYLRADGPVAEATVIRTADLLVTALRGQR